MGSAGSWAALRAGGLPRALNYLGMVLGASGLLTVVPVLEVLGAVFGLGLIVWFAWLGIVMLRGSRRLTHGRAFQRTSRLKLINATTASKLSAPGASLK